MAHRIASRFPDHGESIEGPHQNAALGPMKAVDRPPPGSGTTKPGPAAGGGTPVARKWHRA
ncbi:hypothetical protein [Streptomyces griseofuscus]|uniref:hypothetical protein n=1 Tax=Streptomyces griseofuscus TaxID=146922 RepID=UPI0037A6BCB3